MSIAASRPRRVLVLLASLAGAVAALAPAAGAATTLLGPPNLNGATVANTVACSTNCLLSQQSPSYVSPISGEIVEWQVKGTSGKVFLEVLEGDKVTAVSTTHTAAGIGKEGFSDAVPIAVGQRFGVGIMSGGGEIGIREPTGSNVDAWTPNPFLNETKTPSQTFANTEILANVKIQPAPSVESVTPAAGPVDAENTVTIKGHDFLDIHTVSFGSFGSIFEVLSETELVAHPFGFDPGPVSLTITAGAGTVNLPSAFTFEPAPGSGGTTTIPPVTVPSPIAPVQIDPITFPKEPAECHVPKVKGKTLKQAKPILLAAHCKLGTVTRRRGVSAKSGKVKTELPPAGARAQPGTKVQIRLG
jgi:hypothetical protein